MESHGVRQITQTSTGWVTVSRYSGDYIEMQMRRDTKDMSASTTHGGGQPKHQRIPGVINQVPPGKFL